MKRHFSLFLLAAAAGLPLTVAAAQQQQPAASIEVLSTWVYPRGALNYTTAQGISNDGNVAGTFTAAHEL